MRSGKHKYTQCQKEMLNFSLLIIVSVRSVYISYIYRVKDRGWNGTVLIL